MQQIKEEIRKIKREMHDMRDDIVPTILKTEGKRM